MPAGTAKRDDCLVQPEIAQAPSDVPFKIFIERDPANRLLEYMVNGENYRQVNSRELDGEASPAVFDIWFKRVACGHYVASRSSCGSTAEFRIAGSSGCSATPVVARNNY